MVQSLPLLSCESSLSVKEKPDRKKMNIPVFVFYLQHVANTLIPFSNVMHLRKSVNNLVTYTFFISNQVANGLTLKMI